MLVREIMTRPAYSLPSGSSIAMAAQLMTRTHVTSLPIVNPEGNVVGIVSEADILREPLEPDPRAHLRTLPHPQGNRPSAVDEVMTCDPFTTDEGADVADVARTLTATGWKSLPVLRDGRLIGMVSRSDVLRTLTRSDAEIRQQIDSELAQFGQEGWEATVSDGVVRLRGVHAGRDVQMAESIAASVAGVRRIVVVDVEDAAGNAAAEVSQ